MSLPLLEVRVLDSSMELLPVRADAEMHRRIVQGADQVGNVFGDRPAWQPGGPILNRGRRILLGVASYSVADLALLDTLNEAHGQGSIWPGMDVFNVLDCQSMQDFEKYVPGIGKVFQTPVVGYWEEGLLKEKAWGKAGRDLLATILNLSL